MQPYRDLFLLLLLTPFRHFAVSVGYRFGFGSRLLSVNIVPTGV